MKKLLFLCGLLLSASLYAQDGLESRKHLLRATATISPGIMLEEDITNIYIHGFLEYFPESKVSLRGDGYFFLGSDRDVEPFRHHHSLFWGAYYHPVEGKFDPFVGFQPGLNFTYLNYYTLQIVGEPGPQTIVYPALSVDGGVNYFVSRYFNFFVSVRYMNAKLTGKTIYPVDMDELRISGGLGFSLPL